jgi:hypothetical protein
MNHSVYSADRTTHLKIVVVALVVSIAVVGLAVSARSSATEDYAQATRIIRHLPDLSRRQTVASSDFRPNLSPAAAEDFHETGTVQYD